MTPLSTPNSQSPAQASLEAPLPASPLFEARMSGADVILQRHGQVLSAVKLIAETHLETAENFNGHVRETGEIERRMLNLTELDLKEYGYAKPEQIIEHFGAQNADGQPTLTKSEIDQSLRSLLSVNLIRPKTLYLSSSSERELGGYELVPGSATTYFLTKYGNTGAQK